MGREMTSPFGNDPPLAHELQCYLNATEWSFVGMTVIAKRYEFCLDPKVRYKRESELSEQQLEFLETIRRAYRHYHSKKGKKK